MKHLIIPILASATVLSTTTAHADLGDQLFKLLPKDGAADDRFGRSVAISGCTAIVGAYADDDNGENSGSAFLFDTATGQQIAKLLPNDGAAGDQFGRSVAISNPPGNEIAIVGAFLDDDIGSAYLFDATTGQQLFKLSPDDGTEGDFFGLSVAISGTPGNETAIVGAPEHNANGLDSGSAYLFDITTGQQLSKLLANDGEADDRFGSSVGITESIAIVTAELDDDNGTWSGAAYLFNISDPAHPVFIAKLLANDGAAWDRFGNCVAISGTHPNEIAIIGAFQDDDNGLDSGSAYLFNITTGQQIAKLLPDDGAEGDFFGSSVGISGPPGKQVAIVGALHDDDSGIDSGSVYLFDISIPAKPVQIAKLLANDGAANDEFGGSVAIGGIPGTETAIIAAELDDDNGSNSGSAYLFDAEANICPWDIHGDGMVGPGDLLILLGWWGFDPEGPPDFDEDGIVSTSDLLILLTNWGPCP